MFIIIIIIIIVIIIIIIIIFCTGLLHNVAYITPLSYKLALNFVERLLIVL